MNAQNGTLEAAGSRHQIETAPTLPCTLTFPQQHFKLPNSLFRSDFRSRLGQGTRGKNWESGFRRRIHRFANMTEQRVSYTLDSTLETVDSAEQTASRLAADAGFDDEDVMKISMAVREAAVNAVLHGNAYDPAKKVVVDFQQTRERPGDYHS